MTTNAATPNEATFALNATATSTLDLGPLLASHWRSMHAIRLLGGARYWRRRRAPRWVQLVELLAKARKQLEQLERSARTIEGFETAVEGMHESRLTAGTVIP